MKKLMLALLLFGFIASGHSQILLKETKVDYRPETMKLDPISNTLVLEIPEKKYGEFEKDPLAFVRNQFDIQKVIRDNKDVKYDFYQVYFKTSKGKLTTHFDEDGDLVSSLQKFKNVKLPDEARLRILQDYRNAVFVSNQYRAVSKGWDIQKELYKVKIKDGNRTRRLKINKENGSLALAKL